MPCALTSSIPLGCKDAVGGIAKIYITELANKAAVTASAGNITAFTLATGKQFWIYDLEKEQSEFTEGIQASQANGTVFFEQTVKVRLMKRDATKRNEIALLAVNRVMIIVLDRTGQYWLIGEVNGADLAPSTSVTGKAMGDFNGYELTLIGKEVAQAQTVSSSLIAALTAPAT